MLEISLTSLDLKGKKERKKKPDIIVSSVDNSIIVLLIMIIIRLVFMSRPIQNLDSESGLAKYKYHIYRILRFQDEKLY